MSGIKNLLKNSFLAQLKLVQNFHYFCKGTPVEFPSKIQFSKNCLKFCRNLSFDEWNKEFTQKIFSKHNLRQYKIFTIFVRSAPVEFPSKIQLSKNCLKFCRNLSFDEWNKEFPQKIVSQHNLKQYKIFTIFVRSAPVEFPSKIYFSKNCLKFCRNLYFDEWNKEFTQKIVSKHNLRQYKIFTIFVRSAPVDFPSKIPFSKNILKFFRNLSFDEWNKEFPQKKVSKHNLRQYKYFTIFARSAPVEFPSKIQFSKNCLKFCRNLSFDEWNKEFPQKIVSQHNLRQYKIFTIFVRSAPVSNFRQKFNFPKIS